MGYPTVYPTSVTVYNPDRCWNGYTLFPAKDLGAALIDMNGNLVQLWKGLQGMPDKLLPGGQLLSSTGRRDPRYGHQDHKDLVQVDWDGKVTYRFNRWELIDDPGIEPQWMARQHHDFQREGNPVGYYVPGMEPLVNGGHTLLIVHKETYRPDITDRQLLDDVIIEVNWEGDVIWQWACSDHFEELGFDEEARQTIFNRPRIKNNGKGFSDWMHINAISQVGPNRWWSAGDRRFNPENIIFSSRQSNIVAIIEKQTGKIVWKIGPDYSETPELKKLAWIIGQHHAHIIPKGLPGEGNILLLDNGGHAGYGAPNPGAPAGHNHVLRDYSRVLEFDPTTLEVIWQYSAAEAGYVMPHNAPNFYTNRVGSVQRLPNGNTLITEGNSGRLLEVTRDHELVWEYISPFFGPLKGGLINLVYRAYRAPYAWVPQLDRPQETRLERRDVTTFQLPNAGSSEPLRTVEIETPVGDK